MYSEPHNVISRIDLKKIELSISIRGLFRGDSNICIFLSIRDTSHWSQNTFCIRMIIQVFVNTHKRSLNVDFDNSSLNIFEDINISIDYFKFR